MKTRTPKSSSAKKRKTNEDEDATTSPKATSTKTRSSSSSKSSRKHKDEATPASPKTKSSTSSSPSKGQSSSKKAKSADSSTKASSTPAKPPPQVDVSVHRLRHLQYHPKPVLCICPYNNFGGNKDSLVAVSRENGSVELRSAGQKMRTVAVVAGVGSAGGQQPAATSNKPISCLAWTTTTTTNEQHHQQHRAVVRHPTLVGASRDGSIFVVDFASGQLTRVTPSGGGGVFGLSALVISSNKHRSAQQQAIVAAGCEDGGIRLFRVVVSSNNDAAASQLELLSSIPSAGAAVLDVVWTRLGSGSSSKNNPDKTNPLAGTTVFCSVADGTIRRYDYVSSSADGSSSSGGTWKSTLRMTVESLGRTTPTRVWTLAVLPKDATVISGDSLGHVQFWDGMTGTMQASFDQNDAKADVLDLAVVTTLNTGTNNSNTASGGGIQLQQKVFASGVDSRVVCIERTTTKRAKNDDSIQQQPDDQHDSSSPWLLTNAHRPHTHDVQAVAVYQQPKIAATTGQQQGPTTTTPVLITGGLDTKLCTYSVHHFSKRRPRTLYPWPSQQPVVQVATQARLVTMMREDQIQLYQLASAAAPETPSNNVRVIQQTENDNDEQQQSLIGTIGVSSRYNLAGCSMSPNGRFFVICDSVRVLLFQLDYGQTGRTVTPRRVSLNLPETVTTSSDNDKSYPTGSVVAMKFVQDNVLVVAFSTGVMCIVALTNDDDDNDDDVATANVVQTIPPTAQVAAATHRQGLLLPIDRIVASVDGSWFATSRNVLDSGAGGTDSTAAPAIEVYQRDDSMSNEYQRKWSVPPLDMPHTALAFLSSSENEETASQQLVVTCVNYATYVFDLDKRRLSDWSEAAGFPVSKSLPMDLSHRSDFPVRIAAHPTNGRQFFLGSFGAMAVMDTSRPFPTSCRHFPESHVRSKKRKRAMSDAAASEEARPESSCTLCLRYNSMLHMDFLSDREMVIVEQPWLSVVATFPEALQRSVYGS